MKEQSVATKTEPDKDRSDSLSGFSVQSQSHLRRLLIIAFSAGYELGHNDTVEGYFCGNGVDSEHDEMASEIIMDMVADGAFDREVSHA